MLQRTHRFTLIEILVVMSIIVVLIALLMVGLSATRARARKLQAESAIRMLQTAITQYRTTYTEFPFVRTVGYGSDFVFTDTSNPSATDLVDCLSATGPVGWNLHKVQLVDKNSVLTDPWGRTLRVALDFDASNAVEDAFVYGAPGQNTAIVVWSRGPDGLDNPTDSNATNRDNIHSWK